MMNSYAVRSPLLIEDSSESGDDRVRRYTNNDGDYEISPSVIEFRQASNDNEKLTKFKTGGSTNNTPFFNTLQETVNLLALTLVIGILVFLKTASPNTGVPILLKYKMSIIFFLVNKLFKSAPNKV